MKILKLQCNFAYKRTPAEEVKRKAELLKERENEKKKIASQKAKVCRGFDEAKQFIEEN